MIDLYTWPTPNGRKVSIMLEELGVPYTVHAIDIGKEQQFSPEFLDIAPNNKIPAILDNDNGHKLMESGAILVYLARKYGRFLPTDSLSQSRVMEWVMWQMGGLGPMAGQTHHFLHYNSGISQYAENRFQTETKRLYRILNERLEGRDFIVDEYSIADIACWPWIARHEWQRIDLAEYSQLQMWYRRIAERDAVQKGYHIPHFTAEIPAV